MIFYVYLHLIWAFRALSGQILGRWARSSSARIFKLKIRKDLTALLNLLFVLSSYLCVDEGQVAGSVRVTSL